MDFFLSIDWLGREGPFGLNLEHLIYTFLLILIGVGLGLLLRKKSKALVKKAIIIMWAFSFSLVIFYYSVNYTINIVDPINHPFN